jgi:hypothetical protein
MRNFRFDTGFITGFDAGNYLLLVNLLLRNKQLLSNLRLVCSTAESLSLLRVGYNCITVSLSFVPLFSITHE